MTIKPLPEFIQPLRLAERGGTLSGTLPLACFSRLADFLTHLDGEVVVNLAFGQDDEHIPYVKGRLEACLPLECQRCLGRVDYHLALSINLSPVFSDAAGKKVPDRYEPLLLQEDQILLQDVIEEELLLSLPLAPKHENTDCKTPI